MASVIPVWTVDFETAPIGPRPHHYPPVPVGVAVRPPDGPSCYLAWGHPTGNNCDFQSAQRALGEAWRSGLPIVFHNAKFDVEVAYRHMVMPPLPWDRIHDTMFLAYLLNPYARSIGLKQLAVEWLGMLPDEQDAVSEWIMANRRNMPTWPWVNKGKGPSKKTAGAWIAYAPGEIVAPYAAGDTDRTWGLFQIMHPQVVQSGMGEAYDVERRLMPHLMENERTGLRVDVERLERDVSDYSEWFGKVEDWLRWRLGAPGLNFDADADVAQVLEDTGVVTDFPLTATGRKSVAKDALHPEMFADLDVASALGYRNRLKTCLDTFMRPWLAQALDWPGRISCTWNQVASPGGGTRTGRPSTSNHNFLNISKSFHDKNDGYQHPAHLTGLPELPLVRGYILPDEGQIINGRDFSGQEMRIFAHFEQGDLAARYAADPNLDVHDYVGENITRLTSQTLGRGKVKILNFQALYGGGVTAAQTALRCTREEALRYKAFHDQALPGRKILADQLSLIVRAGGAIRTYGGRLYVRPPLKKQKDGRLSDSDYILINYLIQGSAADATKRAILAMLEDPDYRSRFMLQVYDEIVVSSPVEVADEQSLVMKRAMEGVPLRVKLLTDAEQGYNWGAMKDRKDL